MRRQPRMQSKNAPTTVGMVGANLGVSGSAERRPILPQAPPPPPAVDGANGAAKLMLMSKNLKDARKFPMHEIGKGDAERAVCEVWRERPKGPRHCNVDIEGALCLPECDRVVGRQ